MSLRKPIWREMKVSPSGEKLVSKIQSDKEYRAALRFAQTFNPRPGTDYEWVIAHADTEYKRLESIGKELDTKADSFIRYLASVVSALSLLLASDFAGLNDNGEIFIFPAMILMIVAIVCAALARFPEMQPLPMATTDAFKYADGFKPAMVARACSAAMTNVASVGLRLTNERKARRIRWAFSFLIFALVWLVAAPLVLPLAISILTSTIGRS